MAIPAKEAKDLLGFDYYNVFEAPFAHCPVSLRWMFELYFRGPCVSQGQAGVPSQKSWTAIPRRGSLQGAPATKYTKGVHCCKIVAPRMRRQKTI